MMKSVLLSSLVSLAVSPGVCSQGERAASFPGGAASCIERAASGYCSVRTTVGDPPNETVCVFQCRRVFPKPDVSPRPENWLSCWVYGDPSDDVVKCLNDALCDAAQCRLDVWRKACEWAMDYVDDDCRIDPVGRAYIEQWLWWEDQACRNGWCVRAVLCTSPASP